MKEKKSVSMMEYLPQFSLGERDRRWTAVRESMALHSLDCLLLWDSDRFFGLGSANMRYLTQITSQRMGGMAIFPLQGKPIVFAAPPHIHTYPFPVYQLFQNWIDETREMSGFYPVIENLRERGYERANIGIVGFSGAFRSYTIPYQEYNLLKKELPHANVVEATPLLEQVRMIKSPEEIDMLKKSGKLARKKIDAMIESCKPGVKECEVYAEMVKTEIINGGEAFIFNLLASGSVIDTEHRQHLLHGRGQPFSPTTRILKKGDLLITEFHTSYGGYLTAVEKSVYIGKPPKELQRIHDVAAECFHNGIEKFRPGTKLNDVLEGFRSPVYKAKMDYIEIGFHGHGLSSPEFPAITYPPKKKEEEEIGEHQRIGRESLSGEGGIGSLEIKENMVFGTNIDIHDPNWRNDVGIMLGDTIWVTKDGPYRLVETPLEFTSV
jgi:Xaa-Pro aminopeptidase